jgi:hypothetical protein
MTSSGETRPEQGTRIARMLAGDFMRAIPAVSAPVYEHHVQRKAMILGS